MSPAADSPFPNTLAEAIRVELQDVLNSPQFRNSQRCKEFLQFVVEARLQGREEEIKERTIGVEVFGRTPGFETAGDSIVRVRATEVRNRLFRFYADEHRKSQVKISLPAGS